LLIPAPFPLPLLFWVHGCDFRGRNSRRTLPPFFPPLFGLNPIPPSLFFFVQPVARNSHFMHFVDDPIKTPSRRAPLERFSFSKDCFSHTSPLSIRPIPIDIQLRVMLTDPLISFCFVGERSANETRRGIIMLG